MIKLQEAELVSVLPHYIKKDVDVQAISYAYRTAMGKMFLFARKSMLYANIDELPDDVLDLLALELRAQYYEESMDIKTKQNIIKNAILWYVTGGTVAATEQMVQIVFGKGKVVEWYQFDGIPGTFYIETNEELSPDIVSRFNEIVDKVKNKRSRLIKVVVMRENWQRLYLTSYSRTSPHVVIKDSGLNNVWQRMKICVHSRKIGHAILSTTDCTDNPSLSD